MAAALMVLAYCAILFVLASVFVVPVDRVAGGGLVSLRLLLREQAASVR